MKTKHLEQTAMKLKQVIAASLCHFCTFCIYRLRKFFLNNQYKQESSSTTETGSTDELNKNWTTFTNRKTSFLLITKMHGTKSLVL